LTKGYDEGGGSRILLEFQKIEMKMKEIKAALFELDQTPRTHGLPKVRYAIQKFKTIEKKYNRREPSPAHPPTVSIGGKNDEKTFAQVQSARRGSLTSSLPSDMTKKGVWFIVPCCWRILMNTNRPRIGSSC